MKLFSHVSIDLLGNSPSALAKAIASNPQKAEEMKNKYESLFRSTYEPTLDNDKRNTPGF